MLSKFSFNSNAIGSIFNCDDSKFKKTAIHFCAFHIAEGMILDVHIHPTGDCEEDGAIVIGYRSGATYTFTEEDAGTEVFFACDVGQRCEAGQNILVTVSDISPEPQINAAEDAIDSAATRRRSLLALAFAAGVAIQTIL